MISDTTISSRKLLETTQSRRGLARVENAALRVFHRVGIAARECRHTAQALHEVQCRALAFEQRARRAANARDDLVLRNGVSALVEELELLDAATPIIEDAKELDAGQHQVLARIETAGRHAIGGDARACRNVAGADVLAQREVDELNDIRMIPDAHSRDSRCLLSWSR